MIKVQTLRHEIDFSNKGIVFNEYNDLFSDKITRNYSLPFKVYLDDELSIKLGLVNIDNITSYQAKIDVTVIIDRDFYDGYLSIIEIVGDRAELKLFYSKEVLAVFDKKLSELPFPDIEALPNFQAFGKAQLSKSWPEATHNFPKMFREEIGQGSKYSQYEGFVNNYTEVATVWSFPINTTDLSGPEPVAVNKNVIAPTPYLLEVLKVMYASEGLELRGEFVTDEFNKKIVLPPKNFHEIYETTLRETFRFNSNLDQQIINGQTVNKYKHAFNPPEEGPYVLTIKINLTNAMARYFDLQITQGADTLFSATSENAPVLIDDTISIDVDSSNVGTNIIIIMTATGQPANIEFSNQFIFELNNGDLNLFPTTYNLSDFVPDLTGREFINKIRSWLNLKVTYSNNAVYINYLDNTLNQVVYNDNSHLQDPKHKRLLNQNKLFKLTYPNGKEVLVSKNGQTYNEKEYLPKEVKPINIDVLPLDVAWNSGNKTAVYPEDDADILACLYDGLIASNNNTPGIINGRSLTLQNIYDLFWKKWLRFRANAETYKDTFVLHISEKLDINQGIYKYNKKHLVKSIRKKRLNDEQWKVTMETETL